jgi:hypothetical protein
MTQAVSAILSVRFPVLSRRSSTWRASAASVSVRTSLQAQSKLSGSDSLHDVGNPGSELVHGRGEIAQSQAR